MTTFTKTEFVNRRQAEFVLSLTQNEIYDLFPGAAADENGEHSRTSKALKNFKLTPYYYCQCIKTYLKSHQKNNWAGIEVKYGFSKNNEEGRMYSKESMSLQRIHNSLRSFLTKGIYHDYDMKNAHPAILCWLCEEEGLPTTHQRNFIRNRAKLIADAETNKVVMLTKLNTDNARFPGKQSKDLKLLVDEWNTVKKALYNLNKDKYKTTNTKNPISSVVNKLMCIKENELLSNVVGDSSDVVLMFDGFMSREELDISSFPREITVWDEKPIESDVEIPEDFEFKETLPLLTDDSEAVKRIVQLFPHLKCCDECLYVFNQETGMWENDDKFIVFKRILMRFKNDLEADNSHMMSPPTSDSYGGSNKRMNAVCSLIKSETIDNNWLKDNEESGLGKMLFADGIYDFKTNTFTKGFDPQIVFFARIPFNYPQRDEALITKLNNEFFVKPFTKQQNKEGVGEYLRKRFATALAGKFMKDFHFGLGESNAGKSKVVEMMQLTFGGYVGTFNLEQLASKSQGDEAKEYRWALLLRHNRILFSNECKMGMTLNGNIMKRLCGGDECVGRGHGGNETPFTPRFALFGFSNDCPKIEPIDDGLRNRARVFSYTKKFVNKDASELIADKEEKIDYQFDDYLKTIQWKHAFVHVLLDAYSEQRIEIPDALVSEFGEWTKGMSLEDKFDEYFIFTKDKNDKLNTSDLDFWKKTHKIEASAKRIANYLKKKGCESDRLNTQRFWRGLKFRPSDEEESESEPEC